MEENGFKQTEIGLIPEDWEVVRLEDVLSEVDIMVKHVCNINLTDLKVFSLTKEFGLIPQNKRFKKRIAVNDISNYKVVKKWQIVYNPYVIWEGAIHALRTEEIVAVSPVYCVWECKNSDPSFIDRLLRTPKLLNEYLSRASGVVNRRRLVSKDDFLNIKIPIPSLEEQCKIAKVLDKIQQAVELQDRIIEQARNLKKSLMQKLFTEGLYNEEQKETEIGLIPKSWEVVRLEEIFDIFAGGDISKLSWSPIKVSKFIYPIYSNSLENDGLYGFADTYKFPENCITVTARGNLGYVVPRYEKFNAIIRVLVLIPKIKMDIKFAAEAIRTYVKVNLEGASIPQLTRPKLATYTIPLPPIEEQKQIAHIFSTLDKKIEIEKRRKEVLKRLFKTMLQKLMSGEIRLKGVEI